MNYPTDQDFEAARERRAPPRQRPVTPLLAVDIIIEIQDWYPLRLGLVRFDGTSLTPERRDGIVLIERENEPHGFALPGGMVDVGETTEQAAIREAKEETGLDIVNLRLLGVYSNPKRDPRGHTVSIVYIAQALGIPEGKDDAKRAFISEPTQLGSDILEKLVCDHRRILTDYVVQKNG